jgi:hypothetical protein
MIEYKMPEEFYDWLNNCPVMWFRERVEEDGLKYFFKFPEESEEED